MESFRPAGSVPGGWRSAADPSSHRTDAAVLSRFAIERGRSLCISDSSRRNRARRSGVERCSCPLAGRSGRWGDLPRSPRPGGCLSLKGAAGARWAGRWSRAAQACHRSLWTDCRRAWVAAGWRAARSGPLSHSSGTGAQGWPIPFPAHRRTVRRLLWRSVRVSPSGGVSYQVTLYGMVRSVSPDSGARS